MAQHTIYDTDDSLRVLKDCLKQLNLNDKMFPPAPCWKSDEPRTTCSPPVATGKAGRIFAKTIASVFEL